jgi:hypothetical protein
MVGVEYGRFRGLSEMPRLPFRVKRINYVYVYSHKVLTSGSFAIISYWHTVIAVVAEQCYLGKLIAISHNKAEEGCLKLFTHTAHTLSPKG